MTSSARVRLWDILVVGPYIAMLVLAAVLIATVVASVSVSPEGAIPPVGLLTFLGVLSTLLILFIAGGSLASWIYMFYMLFGPTKTVPDDQKVLWILLLLFVQPVGVLVFYFMHVRPILKSGSGPVPAKVS